MLKRFFEVNFFLSNVLVPMAVLALYCGSFAYFSSRFLLEGVSYLFASELGRYVSLIMVGVSLTFFVIFKFKKADKLAFKYPTEKFYPGDFLLLLLPLTPVVQYILNNQQILSPVESLYVLISFVFFSGIYIFAIPALLGIIVSTRTLMILGLAFVFTITSMASLSRYFTWFGSGDLKIQLMFFGGVFLATRLLYNLNNRSFLYLFVAINFVVNGSVQLISRGIGADVSSLPVSIEENKLLSLVEERIPAITPNIYLLVYDAYVPNETMLAYGIDNSSQEDYLSGQGFELYPHTYSIGSTTLETMNRVLDISRDYHGEERRGVSGDGIVQNILKKLDYKTYGLFYSDYMFRGVGEKYDYSIPENITPPYILLSKAILIGEFRFNIGDIEFKGQTRDQFVEAKQSILESISENKVFVYMHTNLPEHTQNSGACLPNETDLFKERLKSANLEMRQDIKRVIENDPDAIVIIAGDHGPYLTKNCTATSWSHAYDISEISRLDIQDRYGAFLAIRWPTDDFAKYDDITVLQDLFPAIFAYLYKDVGILQSRVIPLTLVDSSSTSGAGVTNGIIFGGVNDGEPLFLEPDAVQNELAVALLTVQVSPNAETMSRLLEAAINANSFCAMAYAWQQLIALGSESDVDLGRIQNAIVQCYAIHSEGMAGPNLLQDAKWGHDPAWRMTVVEQSVDADGKTPVWRFLRQESDDQRTIAQGGISLLPNTAYIFEAEVKSNAPLSLLYRELTDGSNAQLPGDYKAYPEWTHVVDIFITPEWELSHNGAFFPMLFAGTGEAWIRNIHLATLQIPEPR